ncbi:MAG: GTP-binding protein [Promethearchaeota archaeon]
MIKLKIIVAGDKDVGKTSLIHRYINDTFQANTMATIGVDFMTKHLTIDGNEIRLSLWDFAGEDKFRNLFPSYCSGANAAIILYDITNPDSFTGLDDWMNLINSSTGSIEKLLICAKHDLIADAKVSDEEAENFVKQNDISDFMHSSAKTGENISNIFEFITRKIIENTLQKCPFCGEIIAKDLFFCTYCGKKLDKK